MGKKSENTACLFCQIIRGEADAHVVYEDNSSLAFLDTRPVFKGHTLLVPREHYSTLTDLPAGLIAPLFANAQYLAGIVEKGMEAQGTFVAMNNRVSQSVPHLHIHIVPRSKGDGLKGFFWPRQKYADDGEIARTLEKLHGAIGQAPMIDRETVKSSGIDSIGYNPATRTLEVAFQNGSVYDYADVSQGIYDAFMAAASKGRFFTYHVRDRFPANRKA